MLSVACNSFKCVLNQTVRRRLSVSASNHAKALPARPKINENDIEESFVKGTGPGGQNKTSSAVQLKHLPSGLVVKSQATRSREQNRKIARQILADKLDHLEKGDDSRVSIKAQRERKKKASAAKKAKRKYRKLDEEDSVAASGSADNSETPDDGAGRAKANTTGEGAKSG